MKNPWQKPRVFHGDPIPLRSYGASEGPAGNRPHVDVLQNVAFGAGLAVRPTGRTSLRPFDSLAHAAGHVLQTTIKPQEKSYGFIGDPTGNRTPLSRMRTWRPNQ